MRNIVFEPQAFQDFNNWVKEDKKIYGKIVSLIEDILRNPKSFVASTTLSRQSTLAERSRSPFQLISDYYITQSF